MKKVENYICEICGTMYNSNFECGKCEGSHKKPVEITKTTYHPVTMDRSGHPKKIIVKFDDGSIEEYGKGR